MQMAQISVLPTMVEPEALSSAHICSYIEGTYEQLIEKNNSSPIQRWVSLVLDANWKCTMCTWYPHTGVTLKYCTKGKYTNGEWFRCCTWSFTLNDKWPEIKSVDSQQLWLIQLSFRGPKEKQVEYGNREVWRRVMWIDMGINTECEYPYFAR